MDVNVYDIYQGEDLDIWLNAKDSSDNPVDISDIDLYVAFINTVQNKILISSKTGEITLLRPNNSSVQMALSNDVTKRLPSGEYVISFVLTKDNKKVIEELHLINVRNSLVGRL